MQWLSYFLIPFLFLPFNFLSLFCDAEHDFYIRLCTCLDALGFTTEITENKAGFLLDENAPELQIILDVCRQVFQKPEAKPIRMSGGTYARYLRKAYSIDSAPGALPADLPKGHGGVHQSDEALSVDAFVQTTLALAVMVARLDLLD